MDEVGIYIYFQLYADENRDTFPAHRANDPAMQWDSIYKRYRVESSDTLPAASWTTLATNLPASASAATSYTETSASASGRRFYRVKLEP